MVLGSFPVVQRCSTAGGYGLLSLPCEHVLRLPRLAVTNETQCVIEALPIEVFEASSDAHFKAASNLRVCTFNHFPQTYKIEEHRRFLSAVEFEALKEKVEGKRSAFGQVTCLLAAVPLKNADYEKHLVSLCKLTGYNGVVEDQLIVGSLDLNKTPKLPDEMCGSRPEGVEGQYRRGYLSNVCVAEAVQKNGVGTRLIKNSKILALKQGISDLYTHVAADNESAKRVYLKCGFVLEKIEKASEARLAGRPPHLLLWMDLSKRPEHFPL